MNDIFISHIKSLIFVILVVLTLWFFLGFILPIFIIKDLGISGSFGDSFGAVNALFSGLAFAGLTATILYQIQINQENRKASKFNLYIKLIDDIRIELGSFELGNGKGLAVWSAVKLRVTIPDRNTFAAYRYIFNFLSNNCVQMIHILNLIRDDKLIDKDEKDLLHLKISLIYSSYLSDIIESVIDARLTFEDEGFNNLKSNAKFLFAKITDILSDGEVSQS